MDFCYNCGHKEENPQKAGAEMWWCRHFDLSCSASGRGQSNTRCFYWIDEIEYRLSKKDW